MSSAVSIKTNYTVKCYWILRKCISTILYNWSLTYTTSFWPQLTPLAPGHTDSVNAAVSFELIKLSFKGWGVQTPEAVNKIGRFR